jgi:hypothetical protein
MMVVAREESPAYGVSFMMKRVEFLGNCSIREALILSSAGE